MFLEQGSLEEEQLEHVRQFVVIALLIAEGLSHSTKASIKGVKKVKK